MKIQRKERVMKIQSLLYVILYIYTLLIYIYTLLYIRYIFLTSNNYSEPTISFRLYEFQETQTSIKILAKK